MDIVKGIGLFFMTAIILVITGFGLSYVGIIQKDFFGTWEANVERKIFDQTKSQVQGTIQALNDYRLQYKLSDNEGHRSALREAMLQEYTAFARKDLLPIDLENFIKNL